MANNDIKSKIILEGEKEYKAALKDAQRELRTLKSELKAETAELGKNATEQQKAEVRYKNLQKQIKEQEKVVQTYKKALDEVKEKYSDDADAIAKWEIKLNDARTTLANMKNDLDGVGNSFKKVEADAASGVVAAKSYADAISSIANAGNAVSDAIEGIFSGMVNTVRDTIGELWADIMDLAGRANAWGDIAGFWNTDAAKIQQWERAVRGATDDFADLTSAVLRINNMDDKQQKLIAEWTGVSGVNYSDRWEYATKVLDEMSKMDYDKMLKASEAIFGAKRATGVMDLLNDWDVIQANLKRFDAENGGLGLTNEQIEDFITIDERVATIKQTWQAFVDSFEAEHFGKLALELTGDAQAILDSFISFMNADNDADRQAALDEFTANIEDFFRKIGEAIAKAAEALDQVGTEFKQSENGYLRLLGEFLTTISKLLEWFADSANIDTVIQSFEILAAFWVTGKGLALIGKIAELASNLKVISMFNGLQNLMGSGGVAGEAAGAAGAGISASSLLGSIAKVAIPVTIAAVTFGPLLQKLTQGTDWEQFWEDSKKAVTDFPENAKKVAGMSSEERRETGQALLSVLLAGKTGHETNIAEEVANEFESRGVIGDGNKVPSPVPSARFDLTAQQREAAEAFWDVWRKEDYTEEEFNKAYDALKLAFEGNESTFNRLDEWLDKLWDALGGAGSEGVKNQVDLPSTWWKTTGADENGITRQDLTAFNALPDKMKGAVSQGVSNIRVQMDGYTVGRLVAPYVSQIIARDMMV